MIQKEKLVQFYFSQYRDSAMALKKKNNDGKKTYEQRIGRLITEMQRTKTGKLTQPHLEEYHRQIRNMAYYALKQKNQYAIMQIRDILMPELVRLDIGTLREEEQELVTSRLLEYLRTERPGEICQHPMRSILKNFAENGIRSQIIDMVPTRPEMEFPRALEMKRHFILHVGPTNCGKTYQALQRLRTAYKGIYLGPLRLLALEVYEKMRESGVPCTMLTGEERIYEENSRVISSTVEMLDIDQVYDPADDPRTERIFGVFCLSQLFPARKRGADDRRFRPRTFLDTWDSRHSVPGNPYLHEPRGTEGGDTSH